MLSVLAAALAAAALAGALGGLARRRRGVAVSAPPASTSPAVTSGGALDPAGDALQAAGFSLALGDVISVGGEEAWLENGYLLVEAGRPVLALLFSGRRVVGLQPGAAGALDWLEPVEVTAHGEPPSSLELHGGRLERLRRLPVDVRALGTAKDLGFAQALVAEYRGLGDERLWLLAAPRASPAWLGRRPAADEIERWGGGKKTLE